MKILCFKFNQNYTLNKEFYFLGIKGVGESCPDFKNSKRASCKTMVSTHTENFSIPAQLERVSKSESFGGVLGPPRGGGGPYLNFLKKPYTERWIKPTPNISAL